MKKTPIKLHAVNVIELNTVDNTVDGIRSFNTNPKGVKEAEKLFKKLVLANSKNISSEVELDACLEDGYFEEKGDYKVIIEWS